MKPIDALSALSRRKTNSSYIKDYMEEIYNEKNDRGMAILIATNVENILQSCLEKILLANSSKSDSIFGMNAPLATFYNKIIMCFALEVIGNETKKNLTIIRAIRNAFAHSKIPINFRTLEVINVCALLNFPSTLPNSALISMDARNEWDTSDARGKFLLSCNIIAANLLNYSELAAGTRTLTSDHPTNERLQKIVRPKPLP